MQVSGCSLVPGLHGRTLRDARGKQTRPTAKRHSNEGNGFGLDTDSISSRLNLCRIACFARYEPHTHKLPSLGASAEVDWFWVPQIFCWKHSPFSALIQWLPFFSHPGDPSLVIGGLGGLSPKKGPETPPNHRPQQVPRPKYPLSSCFRVSSHKAAYATATSATWQEPGFLPPLPSMRSVYAASAPSLCRRGLSPEWVHFGGAPSKFTSRTLTHSIRTLCRCVI